ncbi:MAG: hypothetical protein KF802_16400 [Bdellovibrionaceae bacterium]|nr:hypothetical protein [Pseudobdellovibrionaceae bacterium]
MPTPKLSKAQWQHLEKTLTYGERLLFAKLMDGPVEDDDSTECRVLVGLGYATRIAPGRLEITPAGREALKANK